MLLSYAVCPWLTLVVLLTYLLVVSDYQAMQVKKWRWDVVFIEVSCVSDMVAWLVAVKTSIFGAADNMQMTDIVCFIWFFFFIL